MKKLIVLPILFLIFAGIAIFYLRFITGSSEDSWICVNNQWQKHGNPTFPKPTSGCGVSSEIQTQESSPEQVVEGFYQWYLVQNSNTLSNGSYKDRSELTGGFKMKVEGTLKSLSGGSFDPIFLAQDKPSSIKVGTTVIEEDIARVQVDGYFSGSPHSIMVALIKENGVWKISDVISAESLTPLVKDNNKTVVVYFSNSKRAAGSIDCGVVFGVERIVPKDSGYEAILRQLFIGPKGEEVSQGYTSLFSKSTADILKSVKIVNGVAYVNLKDIRNIIPSASASCGSKELLSEVGETLKHDRKINKVIYAIEGNPQPFYEWIQIGCNKENNFCDATPFKS